MRSSSLKAVFFGAAAALGFAILPQAASARDTVAFAPGVEPGTIVISASQRRLFYVVSPGVAIRYPVAVPKRGKEWAGYAAVDGKYYEPDWSPPAVVRADHPELPNLIPGGSPRNPMGVAALTLDRGEVAIHGTTAKMRASVGTAASYGCIRMLNEDVVDLYSRVSVGSPVIMQP
ncbi:MULTISPECIES: L,D-transpeptidase [Methylocystis]|uniref:L,D-transpeptidase n=1 Tax=Methylocystis TaxID=133 RepID=UPI001920F312|nr:MULTISPECIES: L,D-transpeptidase [Methylocystis]MBL1256281.1 L,D-transpeptidase [Methylocystis sp. Sn-Cys]MDJ0448016.1 L,D-transpeptidase [Methylocystis sp. JR02]